MFRKLAITASLFVLVLSVTGAARAAQLVLEIDPQKLLAEEEPGGLKKCDNLHQTTGSCICCNYHVEGVSNAEAIGGTTAGDKSAGLIGSRVILRNVNGTVKARVARITPLYRLDSGAAFTPAGSWNAHDASGETWVSEGAATAKRLVVASWNDRNGDGLVSPSDELVFDNGEMVKIVNVGVAVHFDTEGPLPTAKPANGRVQK